MSRYGYICHSELYHHGVKGQRWGIRRYQNEDGSLTPEGKKRYGTVENFNKARAEHKRKVKKALAISAGVGAGALAIGAGAYGISRGVKRYKQKQYNEKVKAFRDDLVKNTPKALTMKDIPKGLPIKDDHTPPTEPVDTPKAKWNGKTKKAVWNKQSKQDYLKKMVRAYGPELYVTDDMYNAMDEDTRSWYKKNKRGTYDYDLDRHYGIKD